MQSEIILELKEREIILNEKKNIETLEDDLVVFKPRTRNSIIQLYSILDKLGIGYYGEFLPQKKKEEENKEKEKFKLHIVNTQAEKFNYYIKQLEPLPQNDEQTIILNSYVKIKQDTNILADVEIYRKFLSGESKPTNSTEQITNYIHEVPSYFTSIDLEVSWEEFF